MYLHTVNAMVKLVFIYSTIFIFLIGKMLYQVLLHFWKSLEHEQKYEQQYLSSQHEHEHHHHHHHHHHQKQK